MGSPQQDLRVKFQSVLESFAQTQIMESFALLLKTAFRAEKHLGPKLRHDFLGTAFTMVNAFKNTAWLRRGSQSFPVVHWDEAEDWSPAKRERGRRARRWGIPKDHPNGFHERGSTWPYMIIYAYPPFWGQTHSGHTKKKLFLIGSHTVDVAHNLNSRYCILFCLMNRKKWRWIPEKQFFNSPDSEPVGPERNVVSCSR